MLRSSWALTWLLAAPRLCLALLEFSYPGNVSDSQDADVVSGSLAIKVSLPDYDKILDLMDVMKITLSKLCKTDWPVQLYAIQDPRDLTGIESTGSTPVFIGRFFFYILPSQRNGSSRSQSLEDCSTGLYSYRSEKVVEELLSSYMLQSYTLKMYGSTSIAVTMHPPSHIRASCSFSLPTPPPAILPSSKAVSALPHTTFWIDSAGAPDDLLGNYTTLNASDFGGAQCALLTMPCGCILREDCTWTAQPSGEQRCEDANASNLSYSSVECEACPALPYCKDTSGGASYNPKEVQDSRICSSITEPCACILAEGGCYWNVTTLSCDFIPRDGDEQDDAPCSICARRSPSCTTPQIVSMRPDPLDTSANMGPLDLNEDVIMTFDRPIRLIANAAEAVYYCEGWNAFRYLPVSSLNVSMNQLRIRVTAGVENELITRCQLMIREGTVEDMAGSRFPGMPASQYSFYLKDTIAPVLDSISPQNGSVDVGVEVEVRMEFNEEVVRAPDFLAYLVIFVGGVQMIVTEFNATSPQVSVEHNEMRFALTGLLEYEKEYGILMRMGLQDVQANGFDPLQIGLHRFKTQKRPEERGREELVSNAAFIPVALGLIVMCALFWVMVVFERETLCALLHGRCPERQGKPRQSMRASIKASSIIWTARKSQLAVKADGVASGWRHSMAWRLDGTEDMYAIERIEVITVNPDGDDPPAPKHHAAPPNPNLQKSPTSPSQRLEKKGRGETSPKIAWK